VRTVDTRVAIAVRRNIRLFSRVLVALFVRTLTPVVGGRLWLWTCVRSSGYFHFFRAFCGWLGARVSQVVPHRRLKGRNSCMFIRVFEVGVLLLLGFASIAILLLPAIAASWSLRLVRSWVLELGFLIVLMVLELLL